MEYLIWAGLALCGLITHFLKHLIQARKKRVEISALEYWRGHRAESIMCIVGTAALFLIGVETGTMNGFTAFACGVMGNSAADIIGKRANNIGGPV